jgi:hypothetical protein
MEKALKEQEKRVAAHRLKRRNRTKRRMGGFRGPIRSWRTCARSRSWATEPCFPEVGTLSPHTFGVSRCDEVALACCDGAGWAADEFALADYLGWIDGRSWLTR